jgi:hypothetical protein
MAGELARWKGVSFSASRGWLSGIAEALGALFS